jgi:hypothetical protein
MMLDSYTSAMISMTGMTFDSVGGLYLAYDLLGGERGPLSKITRIVTYSVLAVFFYSFAFNLKFALICGIGLGSIFGLQLDWIGAGKTVSQRMMVALSFARMVIVTVGLSLLVPLVVACIVGAGVFVGSAFSQRLKVSPEYWYEASRKPSFNIRRLGIGLIMGCGMAALVYLGETMCGDKNGSAMAWHLGLTVGVGTAMIASVSPFVEWYADNVPPKAMGYIGAVMFMIGFFIQSIPSLFVLLGF